MSGDVWKRIDIADKQQLQAGREQSQLEAKAGIKEKADQIRRVEMHRSVSEDRAIRQLYFSVADLDLRKALIGIELKGHRAQQAYRAATAAGNRNDLWKAEQSLTHRHLYAAVGAAVCVVLGWLAFGLPGAIGGAVAGYFVGLAVSEAFVRDRRARIAELKRVVQQDEDFPQRLPLFTDEEARTGRPAT